MYTFGFRKCERRNVCGLNHPVCGTWLWQPDEANTDTRQKGEGKGQTQNMAQGISSCTPSVPCHELLTSFVLFAPVSLRMEIGICWRLLPRRLVDATFCTSVQWRKTDQKWGLALTVESRLTPLPGRSACDTGPEKSTGTWSGRTGLCLPHAPPPRGLRGDRRCSHMTTW